MNNPKLLGKIISRVVLVSVLIVSLFLQIVKISTKSTKFKTSTKNDDIKVDDFFNPSMFKRSIPFFEGEYSADDVSKYEKYLNVPINCNENKETNCFEMIKAGKEIEKHMNEIQNQQNMPSILIIFNESSLISSKIGTIYTAFLYSISTKRKLLIRAKKDDLPFLNDELCRTSLVEDNIKVDSFIPNVFSSCCADFNKNAKNIQIEEGMWPQVPYIHPEFGTNVIEMFGINAAYYCLNFLFGEALRSKNYFNTFKCNPLPKNITKVGINVVKGIGKIKGSDFIRRMKICGFEEKETQILTESVLDKSEKHLCNIMSLISPQVTNIVYALGSMTGWLSVAMSGKQGSVLAIKYDSCFDLKYSQSGSIDHLYNPKKNFPYSTNNFFYVCGTNINEARFFKQYLLF